MPLEIETEYFNRNRAEWIKDGSEGRWAVVREERLLGFFASIEVAYEAGVAEFGDSVEFLVKQVTPRDEVETVQRVHWESSVSEDAVQEAGT